MLVIFTRSVLICHNANYSNVTFDFFRVESESIQNGSPTLTCNNSSSSAEHIFPKKLPYQTMHQLQPEQVSKIDLKNRPLQTESINLIPAKVKRAEIRNMRDGFQSDIMIGTETYTDQDIQDISSYHRMTKIGTKMEKESMNMEYFVNNTRVPELEINLEIIRNHLRPF